MKEDSPFNFQIVLDDETEVNFGYTGLENVVGLDDGDETQPTETPGEDGDQDPQLEIPQQPEIQDPNLDQDPDNQQSQDNDQDEDQSDYANLAQTYYKSLQAAGLLYADDVELADDGSNLEEVLQKNETARSQLVAQELINRLPEQFQPVFEYAFNGGDDLQKFLKLEAEIQDLNYDLTRQEDQEQVVREYLASKGNEDFVVDATIDRLKDEEKLESTSKKFFETLKGNREQEKQSLIQQAEEQKLARETKVKEKHDNVVTYIKSQESWQPSAKNEIYKLIYEPKNNGSTSVGEALNKIYETPEHLVQFAKIIKDMYDFEKGFNIEGVQQTKENIKTGLQNQLATILQTQTKSNSTQSRPLKFDWSKTEIAL